MRRRRGGDEEDEGGGNALFRTGLAKDNVGVVVRSPTCGAKAVHVVAHIVIAELANLEGRRGWLELKRATEMEEGEEAETEEEE